MTTPNTNPMIALVDYDNVPKIDRGRGLIHLTNRIATAIGAERFSGIEILRVRLYGGWYDGRNASRVAQDLYAEATSHFPRDLSITHGGKLVRLRCRTELAESLACEPKVPVTHTYRPRSLPPRLHCSAVPYQRCSNPSACPIAALADFFGNQQCPEHGCLVTPVGILTRPEQKLVDSMILADLIHWAQAGVKDLALVSSDDDLWPGIRLALLHGAKLIHLHPKPGKSSPSHYMDLAKGNYVQASL